MRWPVCVAGEREGYVAYAMARCKGGWGIHTEYRGISMYLCHMPAWGMGQLAHWYNAMLAAQDVGAACTSCTSPLPAG